MWQEIADKAGEFIGGTLQDMDTMFGEAPAPTKITGITFEDGIFTVEGEDYSCGLNRKYGGLGAADGWFEAGSSFNTFRFKAPDKPESEAAAAETHA